MKLRETCGGIYDSPYSRLLRFLMDCGLKKCPNCRGRFQYKQTPLIFHWWCKSCHKTPSLFE